MTELLPYENLFIPGARSAIPTEMQRQMLSGQYMGYMGFAPSIAIRGALSPEEGMADLSVRGLLPSAGVPAAFVGTSTPATGLPGIIDTIGRVGGVISILRDVIGGEEVKKLPSEILKNYPLPGILDIFATVVAQKKRRRMNYLNPYALGRAMRRVKGFSKFARKTVHITTHMRMKRAPRARKRR